MIDISVDKKEEERILFERLTWAVPDLLQCLADFYNVGYEKDYFGNIKYEEKNKVKEAVRVLFKIADIKKIYLLDKPKKESIWCDGFYGYYVTIKKGEGNIMEVVEGNDWGQLYQKANAILSRQRKNIGRKCYAILKALVSYEKVKETPFLTCKKTVLIRKAHELLKFDEICRPWYNNLDDLVVTGIVFDTSTVHDRRVEVPLELLPLVKKIILDYEKGG